MSVNAAGQDRIKALCSQLAKRSDEANRSVRRERFWRSASSALAILVVLALAVGFRVGLEMGTPAPATPNISTVEGLNTILCDKHWQPTGQPCAGGCIYERDCYECNQEGCTYAYTQTACFSQGGLNCPLDLPENAHLEPIGQYIKVPAPVSPF